jgi:hypothetical protein
VSIRPTGRYTALPGFTVAHLLPVIAYLVDSDPASLHTYRVPVSWSGITTPESCLIYLVLPPYLYLLYSRSSSCPGDHLPSSLHAHILSSPTLPCISLPLSPSSGVHPPQLPLPWRKSYPSTPLTSWHPLQTSAASPFRSSKTFQCSTIRWQSWQAPIVAPPTNCSIGSPVLRLLNDTHLLLSPYTSMSPVRMAMGTGTGSCDLGRLDILHRSSRARRTNC